MPPCRPHSNVVRWIPPPVVTEQEIDQAVDIFASVVEKAATA